MWFPLIPLYISAAIASSNGFWFQDAKGACPPKEELKPCTCEKSPEATIRCININEVSTLQNVFSRSGSWNVQNVYFEKCVLDYIPIAVAEMPSVKYININDSTLTSMFDGAPDTAAETYLYNCRFRRGMQWTQFKNSRIPYLGFFNVTFKSIDEKFKDSMPPTLQGMWFENSNTVRITENALYRLQNITSFTLTGGSLKNFSRSWFPRPFNAKYINFSYQKITVLPTDSFEGMPFLKVISLEGNLLQTMDQDTLAKSNIESFIFTGNPVYCGCDIKWITTYKKDIGATFWGDCDGPESFHGKELFRLEPKNFNFCQ